MKTLTKFHDPGHGWLRVPMSLVKEAKAKGITFTCYSYQSPSGKYAYLEEDCDAARFFSVFDRNSFRYLHRHTNNRSKIRDYPALEFNETPSYISEITEYGLTQKLSNNIKCY